MILLDRNTTLYYNCMHIYCTADIVIHFHPFVRFHPFSYIFSTFIHQGAPGSLPWSVSDHQRTALNAQKWMGLGWMDLWTLCVVEYFWQHVGKRTKSHWRKISCLWLSWHSQAHQDERQGEGGLSKDVSHNGVVTMQMKILNFMLKTANWILIMIPVQFSVFNKNSLC